MSTGGCYQLKGPFKAGTNILSSLYAKEGVSSPTLRVGISLNVKDWLAIPTFSFTIVELDRTALIQMGRTCMYESDDGIPVTSITFNQDAPESTIVNLVVC